MERDLRMVLEMSKKREDGWQSLILKTEAILGKGIFELVHGIYRHKQALKQSQALEKKLRERTKAAFLEVLETEVMALFIQKMEKEGEWTTIIDDLMKRRTDPYSVVERMMANELTSRINTQMDQLNKEEENDS